jgi:hypothetical protein
MSLILITNPHRSYVIYTVEKMEKKLKRKSCQETKHEHFKANEIFLLYRSFDQNRTYQVMSNCLSWFFTPVQNLSFSNETALFRTWLLCGGWPGPLGTSLYPIVKRLQKWFLADGGTSSSCKQERCKESTTSW